MHEIEKLVEAWKSEVLSAVCLNGCDHICCSMNFDITEEQARLMFGIAGDIVPPRKKNGKPWFYEHSPFDKKEVMFRMDFSLGRDYCPQYRDGRCRVYTHESRSPICADFPLSFDHREKIMTYHPLCRATRPEHISEFFSQVIKLGYRVFDIVCETEI